MEYEYIEIGEYLILVNDDHTDIEPEIEELEE